MIITSGKSLLNGEISIPASKSHTIRALIIGALAGGESVLYEPLDSLDTKSAASAVTALGAEVTIDKDKWIIKGTGGNLKIPESIIDVGNSGTTLYMIIGTASLIQGWTVITGDAQIQKRTAEPLLNALEGLGVNAFSLKDNGMAPIAVRGRMQGGETSVEGISSQYVSSLFLACPLADGDSEINITKLNEAPYLKMTLDWLKSQDIDIKVNENLSHAIIKGGQNYKSFSKTIPADFSTAAFPLCAAALSGGEVTLKGLDMNDSQGDKKVVDILSEMGAVIEKNTLSIKVKGGGLHGLNIDMNEIPDALPILAVTACFAEGETKLYNVAQARIKETDRIAVMAKELKKLGADIKELPDGLLIKGTGLSGGEVHGHGDHRVVMAMAVAGLASDSKITVDTAEAAAVTFPGFKEKMKAIGANIDITQD